MPEIFEYQRRVEFRDTDMAGIVHFSVFFAYMEEAEHAMLRSLGTNVHADVDGQKISWPRVRATCDYRRPLRYDDLFTVAVQVISIGEKSITYGFVVTRESELIAEGSITAVCCVVKHDAPPQSIQIPESFRKIFAVDNQQA
ncbi:MAG TPA: thioesterase family protein [Pirellulaceae bacterium]|nr:thioesterase family protein [Pirellulaceae bacterium]HMO92308.1 thioesterase family protein [Pirellulaceae bacterium]HMP69232.1 thioesterase family protein [Pirellulaceae bacterium]